MRANMRSVRFGLLAYASLLVLSGSASGSTIAGFAFPSCLSHQMNVLRVGQELGQRGHRFVWLISSSQPSSRTLAQTRAFENLVVLEYKALEEHFTQGELSRDPMEVSTCQTHRLAMSGQSRAWSGCSGHARMKPLGADRELCASQSIATLVADQNRAARGLFADKAALQKLQDLGKSSLLKSLSARSVHSRILLMPQSALHLNRC